MLETLGHPTGGFLMRAIAPELADVLVDAVEPAVIVADAALLANVVSTTLAERGLDRMTSAKIESQLCTSALTAHI